MVEIRHEARRQATEAGVSIPLNNELQPMFSEVLLSVDTRLAIEGASTSPAKSIQCKNVFGLFDGKLWPFVFLEREEYCFIALCSTENASPVVLSDIASTLELLKDAADAFLANPTPSDLHAYVCTAFPFGSPIDTSAANVHRLLKEGFPVGKTSQKRPAWKPYLYHGRQRLAITIEEQISAMQYDNPAIPDVSKITGSIYCKAELEGNPEVSVTIPEKYRKEAVLNNFTTHQLVQESSEPGPGKKLCFPASSQEMMLCTYHVDGLNLLPLRGFYQMKETGANEMKLLVQLKLMDDMNNEFEYCRAILPFPNKGVIDSIDSTPTSGTVSIADNGRSVVWEIGTQFTSRNREVALPATLQFKSSEGASRDTSTGALEDTADHFCVDRNAYVQLNFKMQNFTFSRMEFDKTHVSFYPKAAKAQFMLTQQVVSGEYLIWNSLGKARFAVSNPFL